MKSRRSNRPARSGSKGDRASLERRRVFGYGASMPVLIAAGPDWHATASIYAAQAGKDVYCENKDICRENKDVYCEKPCTKNI